MNCIEWCKEFFYKHPATALGLLFGVLLGLSFAAFWLLADFCGGSVRCCWGLYWR